MGVKTLFNGARFVGQAEAIGENDMSSRPLPVTWWQLSKRRTVIR